MTVFRLPLTVALGLMLVLFLGGCGSEQEHPDYVARLGDHHLTEEELDEALGLLPPGTDTVEAREQVIEQWITNRLLYREAQRQQISEDPEVQERLLENERSLLVSTLISRLEDEAPDPTPSELRSYFERHREQLRLREPFVHVRYLSTSSREAAEEARQALREAQQAAQADSLWPHLIAEYADNEPLAQDVSQNYFPEQRLFADLPSLQGRLGQLRDGEIAPILEADSLFHLLQLVERVPAGTLPELAWVEAEVRRRLTMETRKQTLARKVQRLRSEAISRDELDVP